MNRWPMAGRIEERAYLNEVIADPLESGALVAGLAGVGKTRLLNEVTETATNFHVESVTATQSARPLPFGALAQLLPEDLQEIERVDLLAVIGRHLVRRADGRPIILAIDDIHLLDDYSAAFVHHVAVSKIATVLLTLRSGEVAPDAVMALYRDSIVHRLELQPISRFEFDQLIELALDGQVESRTLDQIWEVTQGNVLFARELIGDASEAGDLGPDHGVWRWTGGLGVASRLRESVAARLVGLGAREREFLEILAVAEQMSLSSTARLASDVSLPDLERRGLVVTERADLRTLVRFAHPLFGETLRATMPASLRRRINHVLADDLAADVDFRSGDSLRLAMWREAAGEVADADLLALAAQNANTLCDQALAERLARAAVLGGAGFSAQFELGRALLGQKRFEEARDAFAPLIGSEPSDRDRERLADAMSLAVGWGLGHVDEALGYLESAELQVADPVVKGILHGHRATLLTYGARFVEAAELGVAALGSVDDDAVRLRALGSVSMSLVMSGRINEALALSEACFEPAQRLRDRLPRALGWVVASRSSALFFAGRGEESLGLLELALGSIPHVSTELLAQINAYRGRIVLSLGRANSAVRFLNDASVTLRDRPVTEPSWCIALMAEAHALLGQHDEARAAAAEAVALGRPEIRAFEPDTLRALAWVDVQSGHASSAIDQFWAAAELASSRGQRAFEIIILGDLLRLGEHRAARRAQLLADQVDGACAASIAAQATAVLSGETADYEMAAEAFGAMGSSLVAAELWSGVSAARQREGLSARAAEAARKAGELTQRCEGARTDTLSSAEAPVPLTRREREAANLAANGATNAQIAEELSVSIRTVESHLYAAFAKLGISDRNQLTSGLQGAW